jgi:hypothetical protein
VKPSLDLDNFTTGGTTPYTFTVTGLPAWLSYSSTTHILTGTAPSTASSTVIVSV